ncbi:ribonuclease R [Moheibacter sediminis]|uniref:Ribonuclease R n=1 Tax=Moheibacter sediminis TaxID=1434700 RepID=A0A1W1Y731_9FLAO|nr:ribonuclease R [Moheibacter sediminis]SMC31972.1 ribonuclease R [Moheibacter sediminis]
MPNRKFNSKNKRSTSGKFTKQIIEVLFKNPEKPQNYKQIAASLNLTNRIDKEILIKDLQSLLADKKIKESDRGKFKINAERDYLIGTIDVTQSGSAYVIVDGMDDDIFIAKNKKKNALQGDMVRVYLYPKLKGKSDKPEGEIVDIVKRFKSIFTGIFEPQPSGKYGFVVMNSRAIHVDFYIPKDKFNGAEMGDKVVVEMLDWPDDADSPFGQIIEVLGKPDETKTEMHAILLEYNLPYQFPEEVEREAQELDVKIHESEILKRRDMRSVPTFTIDPKDAKDFDDALSIQKLENGNWEIGVHIADVTHYVRPGTLLEQEAYNRATSVYLVDRVVPMLPENLSNVACSLRPHEDKYTFSAVFEMDDNAKVLNEWYGRTAIHSDRRFTYEEAQEIIEGAEGDMKDEILTLDKLAKTLRNKRMKDGAITFDKIEVKFELDQNDNPVGTYFKISKDANHLIEEFMLLCNRKVSEFVSTNKDGKPNNNTFVYRIHDDPDMDKLQDLRLFIKQFGYSLDLSTTKSITKSMNQLLSDVKGKPEENLIETLAVRTMSKAKYSTDNNVGHYGLAFRYYSHFTSPIRRYPDMMAHRLLQHYLDGGKSPAAAPYEEKCIHSSAREKLATEAERESIKFMQVKFMEQFIGEEFYGFITGVQEYGIFVEIPETRCEGMVRLRNMEEDSFYFDQKNYSIVGRKSGITYQLGDKVLIKVAKADLRNKQLDFELLG